MDDDLGLVRRPVGPPPLALRLAAVLAVPVLLYALVATGQKALDNYRLNREEDRLRAEIVALRDQNIQLQQQLEAAHTDAAVEAIAREQLGLIKPGDKPLILVSDRAQPQAPAQAQPPAEAQPTPEPTPAPPPWRQWWDYFFG